MCLYTRLFISSRSNIHTHTHTDTISISIKVWAFACICVHPFAWSMHFLCVCVRVCDRQRTIPYTFLAVWHVFGYRSAHACDDRCKPACIWNEINYIVTIHHFDHFFSLCRLCFRRNAQNTLWKHQCPNYITHLNVFICTFFSLCFIYTEILMKVLMHSLKIPFNHLSASTSTAGKILSSYYFQNHHWTLWFSSLFSYFCYLMLILHQYEMNERHILSF